VSPVFVLNQDQKVRRAAGQKETSGGDDNWSRRLSSGGHAVGAAVEVEVAVQPAGESL